MKKTLLLATLSMRNLKAETIQIGTKSDFGSLLTGISTKLKANVIGPLAFVMILIVAGYYIVGHHEANEKLKDVLKGIIIAVGGGALIKIFMG